MNTDQIVPDEGSPSETPDWAKEPALYARLLMGHPLITGETLIPTRPVEQFCEKVLKAVLIRQQGLCFEAISGTGKTSALSCAKSLLESRIPNLVVYSHFTHNYQVASIRAYFKFFLDSVGVKNLKGETADLRKRLVSKIKDDASASGYNMAVLLIDEAQKMSINDFYFLKDTINDLDRSHIGLVTVLMAQAPDFNEVYIEMQKNHKLDLFSRFALYCSKFPSLSTEADIVNLFERIDEMDYSESFAVKWTEFFVPVAFARGFRLASQASSCFAALKAICIKLGVEIEFPARQAFFVVRTFLMTCASLDASDLEISPSAWSDAIVEGRMDAALEVANQKVKGR